MSGYSIADIGELRSLGEEVDPAIPARLLVGGCWSNGYAIAGVDWIALPHTDDLGAQWDLCVAGYGWPEWEAQGNEDAEGFPPFKWKRRTATHGEVAAYAAGIRGSILNAPSRVRVIRNLPEVAA